jgi:hypothetical protein
MFDLFYEWLKQQSELVEFNVKLGWSKLVGIAALWDDL